MKNIIYLVGLMLLLLLPMALATEEINSGSDYVVVYKSYSNPITAFFSRIFISPQAVLQPFAEPNQAIAFTGEVNMVEERNAVALKWTLEDASGTVVKTVCSPVTGVCSTSAKTGGYCYFTITMNAPSTPAKYTYKDYISTSTNCGSGLTLQDVRPFEVVGHIEQNCPASITKTEQSTIDGGTKSIIYFISYKNYPTCSEDKSLIGAEVSCNSGYEAKGQGINAYCSKITGTECSADTKETCADGTIITKATCIDGKLYPTTTVCVGSDGGTSNVNITPIVIVLAGVLVLLVIVKKIGKGGRKR